MELVANLIVFLAFLIGLVTGRVIVPSACNGLGVQITARVEAGFKATGAPWTIGITLLKGGQTCAYLAELPLLLPYAIDMGARNSPTPVTRGGQDRDFGGSSIATILWLLL